MSASATTEEDVCNHVKVVVRVRPENEKEKDGKFSKVVHVVDQHILVFDPKEEEVSFFHGKKILHRDINKRKNKDLKFVFDAVFSENSSQIEVFEHTTKTVLDGFLNGYNCTVLAYGATGAGKTYTMLGSPKDPGVMYLTLMELYNCMDQIKEDKLCTLAVSYLEVYNEQIRDLLVNSGPLAVREDAQRGVVVQGLTLHQPKSAGEILQLLDHGNQNRTQHPTDVNASSSRSHAVFQIYLRQQDKTASISRNVHIAKMSLIDLAGSERASTTNAKGARFREGANINRSLLALGNVINALADPKLKSNIVSLDSHMSQYAKICDEQKKEILMLKEKLRAFEEERAAVPENRASSSLSNQQQVEIQRFQEILKSLFVNREEIRKEHLKLEMQLKENAIKTYYQKQCHEQIQLMCSEERIEKATCKRDHRLSMLKTRCLHVQKKKENMVKKFEENNNWLHRVENEMRLLSQDGHIPQELHKDLHYCHLKLEVKDLKTQINHILSLVSLQEQHHKQTEKVLNTLLPVLRRQYLVLKEAGLANDIIEADFKEVEQVIQRPKTVVWADQTMEKEPKQNDQLTMSVIIAFPQLVNSSTTPCRTSPKVKNNVQLATECVGPLQKRTRRKLMDSPATSQSPKASQQSSLNQLEDSLSKEVRPIVYTPEACRKLEQNPCTWAIVKQSLQVPSARKTNTCNAEDINVPLKRVCNMNSTFHISECEEMDMNSTVTLYRGTTETNDASAMLSEKESQSCSNSSVLQRLGLPSLLNRNPGPIHEKPSYMAMTSAAERKRKLLSSTSNTGLSSQQEPVSAKRVRQDILLSHKPLRVLKTAALRKKSQKQEQAVQRNLVRSLSEGNVALGVKSRTSKKLLIQVCKKK
uniref:Kinesin-like protein n=1 Tax=Crocodylus porosus TaxID=8502 RepID=A0A7M4EIJ6_CROPO